MVNQRQWPGHQSADPQPSGSWANDQPDMMDKSAFVERMRGKMVPFDDVIRYLDNKNVPPQLREVSYVQYNIGNNDVRLILPANPNRMGFILAQPQTANTATLLASMSYGFPNKDNNGNFIGIPFANGGTGTFQEGNGTVSIDDIYVFCNGLDAEVTISILAYEGVLAVESHLHNQTA